MHTFNIIDWLFVYEFFFNVYFLIKYWFSVVICKHSVTDYLLDCLLNINLMSWSYFFSLIIMNLWILGNKVYQKEWPQNWNI